MWTNVFAPPIISSPSATTTITETLITTPSITPKESNNHTVVLVGAILGSLIGGILLSIGGFLLYKRRNVVQEKVIPTPGGIFS